LQTDAIALGGWWRGGYNINTDSGS
jgi:hypothetical protein